MPFRAAGARATVGAGPPGDPAAGAADSTTVRRAALGLLARREFASSELRTRLFRKLGTDAPVDAVLAQLADEGLLDDTRFIEAFVRMHRTRGHGPIRILHELAQRGVDAGLAEAGVAPRDEEWIELARKWRERRFGRTQPRAAADWQRQARHLQARGFSSEQVRKAMCEPAE